MPPDDLACMRDARGGGKAFSYEIFLPTSLGFILSYRKASQCSAFSQSLFPRIFFESPGASASHDPQVLLELPLYPRLTGVHDATIGRQTLRQRGSAATTQLEVRVKGSSVCQVSGCWVERVTYLLPSHPHPLPPTSSASSSFSTNNSSRTASSPMPRPSRRSGMLSWWGGMAQLRWGGGRCLMCLQQRRGEARKNGGRRRQPEKLECGGWRRELEKTNVIPGACWRDRRSALVGFSLARSAVHWQQDMQQRLGHTFNTGLHSPDV